tara:strand:- start:6692 stop:6976 length:285 start_codon:yes stop_codon:yes gene_type:complete
MTNGNENESFRTGVWLAAATGLGALVLVLVQLLFYELDKPDRTEVSEMIIKEAPVAIQPIVKEIKDTQKSIQIQQAITVSKLDHIVELLSRVEK